MTFAVALLHLICQNPGVRSDFLLEIIQLSVGVVRRIPLAQLNQVDVEVVAARDGEGTMYSGVQRVPRW